MYLKQWFMSYLRRKKQNNNHRAVKIVFLQPLCITRSVILIKKFLKFIFDVIGRSMKDGIGAYSANTAFFVTVSFIPFIMLLISMVKFMPVEEAQLVSRIISVFPKGTRDLVASFVTESYQKSGTAIISITAVSTLWAASIGVFSLVHGLNRVYCANETRNYIIVRFMSMIYTLFVMALLVLCLTIFVFGDTISAGLSRFIPAIFEIAPIVMSLRLIVGIAVLTAFFLVMYALVPNRKTRLFSQLPGALIGGIGWVGFSSVFSFYYENMANYSYVYGSLSVLVFFMLWLYFCIYILFIGAEVNKSIEDTMERKALFTEKNEK